MNVSLSSKRKMKMSIGGDILDWLIGKETTRFKSFLKAHGDEEITSIAVSRQPISKAIDLGMDLITAGEFGKAKSKLGIDNFFHLGLVINNKYFLEKNETVNQRNPPSASDEERLDVPINKKLTIDELIKKASDRYDKKYWGEYSALSNNCQSWIKMTLSASGLYSSQVSSFADQNAERLIKELPSYTSHVADAITDTASVVNRIIQFTSGGALGFRNGGMVGNTIGDELVGKRRKHHRRPKVKGFIR
jgi:hypothetical protein